MQRGFMSLGSLVLLALAGGVGYWLYTTAPGAISRFADSQLLGANLGQSSAYGGAPSVAHAQTKAYVQPSTPEPAYQHVDTDGWQEYTNKNSGIYFVYPKKWNNLSSLFYRKSAGSFAQCGTVHNCFAYTNKNGIRVERRPEGAYFIYVLPASKNDKSSRNYIFSMKDFSNGEDAQAVFEAVVDSIAYTK